MTNYSPLFKTTITYSISRLPLIVTIIKIPQTGEPLLGWVMRTDSCPYPGNWFISDSVALQFSLHTSTVPWNREFSTPSRIEIVSQTAFVYDGAHTSILNIETGFVMRQFLTSTSFALDNLNELFVCDPRDGIVQYSLRVFVVMYLW
jgi:hypothetical protein